MIARKYGVLTDGYSLKHKSMIVFWAIDLLRRALLAIVLVLMHDHLWFQVLFAFNSSIFLIITIGYARARKTKSETMLDIFNELKLILIMYHVMLFTPLVPDSETKYQIGYSCCGALVVGVIINLLKMIFDPIYFAKKRCKVRYALKQAKQKIQLRDR